MKFKYLVRKTFFISFFCFLTTASNAQVYSNKESSTFSFTLGMTSSNLINDSVKYNSAILFTAGFMYTVVISEKFNLGLELLYTGKSFKDANKIIKYRYFYIDVPLYLQYKLSESVRLNIGAQYSSFTNSKIIVIDSDANSGVKIKPYNNIKPSDVGVLAGVEINLNQNFSIAARYTLSASTFFEEKNTNFGVFQFSLNYAVYRTHKQFLNRHKEKV
jgi:hypothetical protein